MKIGEVVKKYGISVNSLYFYINKGLLVPPRRNGQYQFDTKTLKELEWVLALKKMEFSLKTIHRLLSLRRISNFASLDDREEFRKIYKEHDLFLSRKEESIALIREQLNNELIRFEEQYALKHDLTPQIGFPLAALNLLCCPKCGGELMLHNVQMSQKYVFHAALACRCGYNAAIRSGILETGNVNTSKYDKPDITRELYRDLPSMTLSLFERSYRWLESAVKSSVSNGKVWLESYVNAWFFFHNHLNLLHHDDVLIVIDKFPETLMAYKAVIERQGAPCNILYIADSSDTPPLRRGIIDCNMDFFASNEHNFYHPGMYLKQLLPYLKPQCELFGVYFFFKNGHKSIRKCMADYPESFKHNFNVQWFFSEIKQDFHIVDTIDCGLSLDSGSNLGLGFHVPGEELHLQAYHACTNVILPSES